ncbi:MAG TPA: hypothetical protein VL285_24915 [Bryobacteraceae bacterium]|jgi:hypothetical protein|nr:hypothetical protein [Bryobacteraceae bacterium]
MKIGAALAAVLGVVLGVWAYWFYSRPYDAARLVQCLPSDRSLHAYLNVGLLRTAGILDLLAGSQGAEEPDYQKFVEQTGFNYRTDLDAVAAGFRDGDEYFAAQGRFKWDRLAGYAQSHQGKCEAAQRAAVCSMPASQAGKTISFSLLRRDVLALAVARDPQGSRVIFPGFWKDPPQIPTAAVWVSAPPYIFADAKTLPAGLGPFRTQLAQARNTVFTLGPSSDQKADQKAFELRMMVDCTTPDDATKMAGQFSSVTDLLKKMLHRDNLKPAPADLTGILVSGHFEAQKGQVIGTWPIERKFIESLVSGRVE